MWVEHQHPLHICGCTGSVLNEVKNWRRIRAARIEVIIEDNYENPSEVRVLRSRFKPGTSRKRITSVNHSTAKFDDSTLKKIDPFF